MSWNAWDILMALFPVLCVFWWNNMASTVENTSWKPLEMPFLQNVPRCLGPQELWCEFQSHLLFIISLLLKNFLTGLVLESYPITATSNSPWGEKTRRLIGRDEIPLLLPVSLSVSATISFLTSSKSVNFFPLQWRNSANSAQYAESKVKD